MNSSKEKKRIIDLKGLVIGCGSIGERHINNLRRIGLRHIAICDTDVRKVDNLSLKYKTEKFYDLNSALDEEPDFSFVCTYPSSHLEIANKCISSKSHLFVEKPISSEINGVKKILKKAQSEELKVAVGYNMRFDPGLQLIRKKLENNLISRPLSIFAEWGHNIQFWRPGIDYKNHYILKKGSGIILDDSHEYDYMRWLLNDEVQSVYCQTQKTQSIKTETESLASIVLKFKRGTIGSLIIDYVRPSYERKCHIIGEKGSIKWEYSMQKGSWKNYSSKANSSVVINPLRSNSIRKRTLAVHSNDMYINEVKNFLNSVINGEEPLVNGWEGLKTLEIAEAALESSRKNKVVFLKN